MNDTEYRFTVDPGMGEEAFRRVFLGAWEGIASLTRRLRACALASCLLLAAACRHTCTMPFGSATATVDRITVDEVGIRIQDPARIQRIRAFLAANQKGWQRPRWAPLSIGDYTVCCYSRDKLELVLWPHADFIGARVTGQGNYFKVLGAAETTQFLKLLGIPGAGKLKGRRVPN